MRKKMLNINELDVTDKPVVFTCYGLGSCIGLFITDRLKKISGGAHIPLPSLSMTGEFLDAKRLIHEMLTVFTHLGSNLNYLRAKVTGGARVFGGSINIGQQNIEVVLHQLVVNRIFIAATDVGGSASRTARFNSVTGELQISTSEQKNYSI